MLIIELTVLKNLSPSEDLLLEQLIAEFDKLRRVSDTSEKKEAKIINDRKKKDIKGVLARAKAAEGLGERRGILDQGLLMYPESLDLQIAFALVELDVELAT